jgi:hypothetical protein
MKWLPLIALALLTGCVSPVCKKVVIAADTQLETVTVDHYVPVYPEGAPHQDLIDLWNKTRASEYAFVADAKAPQINQLIKMNATGDKAFAPIEDPNHIATPAEVRDAIEADGAVQAFIGQKN